MDTNDYLRFKLPGGSACAIQRQFFEEYILPTQKIYERYYEFQKNLKVNELKSKEYENYWYKRGL